MSDDTSALQHPSEAWFGTTHWSVVLSARDKASPQSEAALEQLCRAYWCPLYAFVRRQGYSPHDAQDLTQEFLGRLVHKDYLDAVRQERGRFRTFLLVAIKRFLSDAWDRVRAQKRGGGLRDLSLDAAAADNLKQWVMDWPWPSSCRSFGLVTARASTRLPWPAARPSWESPLPGLSSRRFYQ